MAVVVSREGGIPLGLRCVPATDQLSPRTLDAAGVGKGTRKGQFTSPRATSSSKLRLRVVPVSGGQDARWTTFQVRTSPSQARCSRAHTIWASVVLPHCRGPWIRTTGESSNEKRDRERDSLLLPVYEAKRVPGRLAGCERWHYQMRLTPYRSKASRSTREAGPRSRLARSTCGRRDRDADPAAARPVVRRGR